MLHHHSPTIPTVQPHQQWGIIDGMSSVKKKYKYTISFPKQCLFLYGGSISYEYGLGLSIVSNTEFNAGWWPEGLGTQNGRPGTFIAIGN